MNQKDESPERNELLDLASPMWSARHTAAQLDLTHEELDAARLAGRVLGVSPAGGGTASYPTMQFERTPDGTVRVKTRLYGFISTLLTDGGRDPWSVVINLHLHSPELDGMSALEWARARRDSETLTAFARLLNAEFHRR